MKGSKIKLIIMRFGEYIYIYIIKRADYKTLHAMPPLPMRVIGFEFQLQFLECAPWDTIGSL